MEDVVTFYRRLPKFDVVTPRTLDEALGLLKGNHDGEIRLFAGGTDLIPRLKERIVKTPRCLLDLKRIPDLDYVREDGDGGFRIGALASIASVASSPIVRERCSILAQAAGSIASNQIQNRGTVAGNICNAVPSADSAPALVCLDAVVLCASTRGTRKVSIHEFFTGPYKTVLGEDEIVREIQIPGAHAKANGVYIKLSPRSRMDLAVVGVAAMVSQEKGLLKDVRIGLGAVAPTPMRAKKAEAVLKGESSGDELLAKAAKAASEEASPIDDHRASAEYRRMMVEVLVKRALRQCLAS
ncbi:MAG: xanthine dehydrogenase family protein subunit M [Deltaproteobacteria bacterium HGW-Deltaproteobacteria-15]|nr:MAG: xanthine dehydrogenase family protein subunit M [Deltaproteobacteria bacterium HGW-Deltaproteobacteria-15]